jgi:hypothetical protein
LLIEAAKDALQSRRKSGWLDNAEGPDTMCDGDFRTGSGT